MVSLLKVIKSLNNSLLLCLNEEGEEVILMGKGIGFQLKKGDIVPLNKVQKIFRLDTLSDTLKKDYMTLFEHVSDELIVSVKKIVDYANVKYDNQLNKNLFFTLVDHLNYAVERSRKGIELQNRLLLEIQRYYPKEYSIGEYGVELLNKNLQVNLSESEAANIAFHIVNASESQSNMEETVLSVKMLKDILGMIGYLFPDKKIDKESLFYQRFVTHIQFFIMRMIKNEKLENTDEFLLESVKEKFPKEYKVALKIRNYVEEELSIDVAEGELLYLTLHLSRIFS